MDYLLKFIQVMAEAVLTILQVAVFIRCIMSFFSPDGDSVLQSLVYTITEPFLAPIRALFDKIPSMANLPLDFSPIVLILILQLVSMLFTTFFSLS